VMMCWGDGSWGKLGAVSPGTQLVPADVVGLSSKIAGIALGSFDTCVLTAAGRVGCWGARFGYNPGKLYDVSGIHAISAGRTHACALTSDDAVMCWGGNYYGEIGNNSHDEESPAHVPGVSADIAAITASPDHHTCALTSSGGALCLGPQRPGPAR